MSDNFMNLAAQWKDLSDYLYLPNEEERLHMAYLFYAGAAAVLRAYNNIKEAHENSEAAGILVGAIDDEILAFINKADEAMKA